MNPSQKPRLHQDWIDPRALKIVESLQKEGFLTYLVGGCVRDLLLGIAPKDFDISTMASPNEVRRCVPNAFVIGKRFRLVLVKRQDQQFEVSTFRRNKEDAEPDENLPDGDNLFGSPEEDALRRDFTVNGMFYDPVSQELIDHSHGLEDLKGGLIRMIGDPVTRLKEDPIRILRAIRLAHKIDFAIEPQLRKAIVECGPELIGSALPRRREEFLKFLRLRDPSQAFLDSYDLGVLANICPSLQQSFSNPEATEEFLQRLRFFRSNSSNPEPLGLMAQFIFSFVRSYIHPDPSEPLGFKALLDHPVLQPLMKEEMGLFKYEQSLIAKALHIQSLLARRKEFERKGSRRQMALLTNEAFPLALDFAKQDFVMNPSDYFFWLEKYEASFETISEHQEKLKKRRKRPRRRRPTTKEGGKKQSESKSLDDSERLS